MDMVTLALQRTNVRVLKRSSGRSEDFVYGGVGRKKTVPGNTGVCGDYKYISYYMQSFLGFLLLLIVGV